MIDRKADIGRRDLNGCHHGVDIELRKIVAVLRSVGALRFQPGIQNGGFSRLTVVFIGAGKFIFQHIGTKVGLFGAECLGDALLFDVVLVGRDNGIKQNQNPQHQQNGRKDREEATATLGLANALITFFHSFRCLFLNLGI